MKKKQYDAPEFIAIMNVIDVMAVSLGDGEKGVWDDELFGN